MAEKCDYLTVRFEVVGCDMYTVSNGADVAKECLRPQDHKGPHLIRDHYGRYKTWEYDPCPFGTCESCDGEDPEEQCMIYGEISEEEALLYMSSKEKE